MTPLCSQARPSSTRSPPPTLTPPQPARRTTSPSPTTSRPGWSSTPPRSPTGASLIGADPTTGAGGTLTWTIPGPIDPGASVLLTYSARLAPSAGLTTAPQVNRADITGYASLPSGGRQYPATPTADAPVNPIFPFVQAAKSTPQGTIAYIGEPFTWQITLTNTGAGIAYAVGAADILPPNWSYDNNSAMVSVNGGPASQIDPIVSFSGSNLVWSDLANLGPGGSLTITYTATPTEDVAISPGVGLSIPQTNTAAPFAQDRTGATGNQTGSYSGPAASALARIASADMVLTKQVGTQPIAGESGSWTLNVSNQGPDTATGPFTVTDGFNNPLPAGVTHVTASGSGWTCTTDIPLTCTRTNQTDTLAAGAAFPPITVSYNVASDVPQGTIFSNSATVEARTFDPNLDNNTGQASTTVNTQADLEMAKSLTSPQMIAGDPATYAIAVTNLGPSVSAGPFTITDTLPATSTFVSAAGADWECDPTPPGTVGATLTCTYSPNLAVGSVTAQLVVTVGIPSSQTAPVVNTATITSTTTPDPNPANNTASVTTTPATSADLAIKKQHVGTFVAGNRRPVHPGSPKLRPLRRRRPHHRRHPPDRSHLRKRHRSRLDLLGRGTAGHMHRQGAVPRRHEHHHDAHRPFGPQPRHQHAHREHSRGLQHHARPRPGQQQLDGHDHYQWQRRPGHHQTEHRDRHRRRPVPIHARRDQQRPIRHSRSGHRYRPPTPRPHLRLGGYPANEWTCAYDSANRLVTCTLPADWPPAQPRRTSPST